jgi:molybdopterin-guanine dinucleotide biosynthesis protein A
VYHRDCLPFIRARLRSGDVKTAALLDEVGAQYVGEDALRELDRELRFLTNVNTPSDLQNATASVSS